MTNVRFSRSVVYNFFSSCGFPFLSSQASAGTTSNCGRPLPTALTACRLQLSLTKKFSRCMEGSVRIYSRWSKYAESCGQQMFPIQVCPSLHRSHWFVLIRMLRVTLWPTVVGSRQGHHGLVRKWPRCVLHIWPGCRIKIPAETWYGFDLSSASGVLMYHLSIVDVWAFVLYLCQLFVSADDQSWWLIRLSKMDTNSSQRDI